jgi:hypothetical protein
MENIGRSDGTRSAGTINVDRMMVDREVMIEYGGEAESGASTGARTATAMPSFTDKALERGLGAKVNRQIENALKNVIRAREESAADDARDQTPRSGSETVGLADID